MERFLNIDWNLPLEDLIDNVFVHDDRMEQESAMYKIMRGNFTDPFKDIEDDYNDVNLDIISECEGLEGKDDCTQSGTNVMCDKGKDKQSNFRTYVPGIVKPTVKFPRSSCLSKEQHCTCLKVLSTFFGSQAPDMTQSNREDLETYYQLKDSIAKEQNEYLELAKKNWDCSKLKVTCENYINMRWKIKMQRLIKLPRYYVETLNVPFTGNQKLNLTFLSTLSRLGNLETIELPILNKPFILYVPSKQLEKHYITSCAQSTKSVVSADPICENLATQNDIDLVISSSGLYTILNNIAPSFTNSWTLPVVIKVHNNKHTIYIDKPLPPTSCTIPEKNTWVYKYILKYHLLGPKSPNKKSSVPGENVSDEESIFGDVHSDDLLKLEETEEHDFHNGNSEKSELDKQERNSKLNAYENVSTSQCSAETRNNNPEGDRCSEEKNQSSKEENKHPCKELKGQNVSYNLFGLTPQPLERTEFLKSNITKQYKILVRSTIDGVQNGSKEDDKQSLMIVPKLEHQVSLGAEAITVDEGLKQWTMLTFRPGTSLARVRLSATTSEVLQIEKRNAISISRELRRLYNINVEDNLTILYNVIQELINVPPGRYLMRHNARTGAFATLYKEADKPQKNAFDLLHTINETSQFNTTPVAPWPMLDKMLTTPMLKCFERMPCMYYPPKSVKTGAKRKLKKNNGRKPNAGQLRRSPRIKSES